MENAAQHREAPCPHYERCGGCSLQHLTLDDYHAYKTDIARTTLSKLGVDESVLGELFTSGEGTRRRTKLSVRKHKKDITIGYAMKKSHEVVDVKECTVLDARLVALFAPLKALVSSLKKSGTISDIHLNVTQNLIDISFTTKDDLISADKVKIASFGAEHGIARITASHDAKTHTTIHRGEEPFARFGDVDVSLSPWSFMQATEASEHHMAALVLEHMDGCNKVADFYAGSGTYSFPLVKAGHHVAAFEGYGDAVAAMHNSIRKNQLESRVEVQKRDLFKQPLSSEECNKFNGIIINPPRNGALSQVQHIAASSVSKLVMISCNPHTFERDAKALLAGGYHLTTLTPIDQFTYSQHLELVGFFEKR